MFNKDILIGILISSCKIDYKIENNSKAVLGKTIKLNLSLRATKEFLLAVERSLLQHGITSSLKEKESKTRPKPILKIRGLNNLLKITKLVPILLPDSKNEWILLRELVELISNKEHLKPDGLAKCLLLKEEF